MGPGNEAKALSSVPSIPNSLILPIFKQMDTDTTVCQYTLEEVSLRQAFSAFTQESSQSSRSLNLLSHGWPLISSCMQLRQVPEVRTYMFRL